MKTTTDIAQLLEQLGVEVTAEADDEIVGLCPLHEQRVGRPDRKPSWSINRETGLHHCFSCGYAGHLKGLVVDLLGLTSIQAGAWMKSAGVTLAPPADVTVRTAPPPVVRTERLLAAFVPPPDEALAARRLERFAAAHYGVLWGPKTGDWILPVRDHRGGLLGYQRKGRGKVKNVPFKMEKGATLFGADKFVAGRAILVESPLDCVRLYSTGWDGGVASMGALVDRRQLDFLCRRADELIVALDNDAAGRTETEKIMNSGVAERIDYKLYRFNYGEATGKDIGELDDEEIRWGIENKLPA